MKYKDNVRYFFVKVRNYNFSNQTRAAKLINTICLIEILNFFNFSFDHFGTLIKQ